LKQQLGTKSEALQSSVQKTAYLGYRTRNRDLHCPPKKEFIKTNVKCWGAEGVEGTLDKPTHAHAQEGESRDFRVAGTMSNLITNIDTMGASRRCQSGAPNGTYFESMRLYGPKDLVAARVREEG
jgi:hypothetical protein